MKKITIMIAMIFALTSCNSESARINRADYSDPKRLCEAMGYKKSSEAFYQCISSKNRNDILENRSILESNGV